MIWSINDSNLPRPYGCEPAPGCPPGIQVRRSHMYYMYLLYVLYDLHVLYVSYVLCMKRAKEESVPQLGVFTRMWQFSFIVKKNAKSSMNMTFWSDQAAGVATRLECRNTLTSLQPMPQPRRRIQDQSWDREDRHKTIASNRSNCINMYHWLYKNVQCRTWTPQAPRNVEQEHRCTVSIITRIPSAASRAEPWPVEIHIHGVDEYKTNNMCIYIYICIYR